MIHIDISFIRRQGFKQSVNNPFSGLLLPFSVSVDSGIGVGFYFPQMLFP